MAVSKSTFPASTAASYPPLVERRSAVQYTFPSVQELHRPKRDKHAAPLSLAWSSHRPLDDTCEPSLSQAGTELCLSNSHPSSQSGSWPKGATPPGHRTVRSSARISPPDSRHPKPACNALQRQPPIQQARGRLRLEDLEGASRVSRTFS